MRLATEPARGTLHLFIDMNPSVWYFGPSLMAVFCTSLGEASEGELVDASYRVYPATPHPTLGGGNQPGCHLPFLSSVAKARRLLPGELCAFR